jgi:NAD(P)-dependent dehydrogenase (short-subunit alcohol dehydrogenase family)
VDADLLGGRHARTRWSRDQQPVDGRGLVVGRELGVYHAAKAALLHLTRHLAVELAPRVRVNAIAPGIVRTRLAEALWHDHEQELAAATPLGRVGEPADLAAAVVFLAGDGAAWITGETLCVDGGQRLRTAATDVAAGG